MTSYPPLTRQAQTWSCGQACAHSILAYWGVFDGSESDLWSFAAKPQDGIEAHELVLLFKSHKLRARYLFSVKLASLRRWLRGGSTVILAIQAWPDNTGNWTNRWSDGHWVILCELTKTHAIIMDPSIMGQYAKLTIEELEARWHDLDDNLGELHGITVVVKGRNIRSFEGLATCG